MLRCSAVLLSLVFAPILFGQTTVLDFENLNPATTFPPPTTVKLPDIGVTFDVAAVVECSPPFCQGSRALFYALVGGPRMIATFDPAVTGIVGSVSGRITGTGDSRAIAITALDVDDSVVSSTVVSNPSSSPGQIWTLQSTTTPIVKVTFDGMGIGYWIDDFTFGCPDTDLDGISDCWETAPIDFDGDGEDDLDLSNLISGGASCGSPPCVIEMGPPDPLRKDIFVEIDWMEDHEPNVAALWDVVRAFDEAPVGEAGLEPGINLHLLLDKQVVEHSNGICFDLVCVGSPRFSAIKSADFGTDEERTNPAALDAKARLFRYALFAHQRYNNIAPFLRDESGIANIPGQDILITLGHPQFGFDVKNIHQGGSLNDQRGTFMHELGHSLNLQHGGGDSHNCKPNYLSVLNYNRQFRSYDLGLDYSRARFQTLDVIQLDETTGIVGDDPALVAAAVAEKVVFGPWDQSEHVKGVGASGAINWDRDMANVLLEEVAVDIDYFPRIGCTSFPGPRLLEGFNDWAAIVEYLSDFSDSGGDFGLGASPISPVEMTGEQARGHWADSDDDGIHDMDDNCWNVANSGQIDTDRDGIGDACAEPPSGDVDGNMAVECEDINLVRLAFGSQKGSVSYRGKMDLNRDDTINIFDLMTVARALPPGTRCQ